MNWKEFYSYITNKNNQLFVLSEGVKKDSNIDIEKDELLLSEIMKQYQESDDFRWTIKATNRDTKRIEYFELSEFFDGSYYPFDNDYPDNDWDFKIHRKLQSPIFSEAEKNIKPIIMCIDYNDEQTQVIKIQMPITALNYRSGR